MTTISDERLAEMLAEVEIEFDNALLDAEADQNPQLAVDPVGEFDLIELRSILSELLALRAQGGVMAKPTVEQAIESLVSALDEMRSQQAKRDEFLATIIVNIEKNEPTTEFAVNLREYVQNERAAALAAKGGQ